MSRGVSEGISGMKEVSTLVEVGSTPWKIIVSAENSSVIVPQPKTKSCPYLRVYQGKGAGRVERCKVTSALKVWLNGGSLPEWQPSLVRTGPDSVATLTGIHIVAEGPLTATLEGTQVRWYESTAADACISRGLMIDYLMKGLRPNLKHVAPEEE